MKEIDGNIKLWNFLARSVVIIVSQEMLTPDEALACHVLNLSLNVYSKDPKKDTADYW